MKRSTWFGRLVGKYRAWQSKRRIRGITRRNAASQKGAIRRRAMVDRQRDALLVTDAIEGAGWERNYGNQNEGAFLLDQEQPTRPAA